MVRQQTRRKRHSPSDNKPGRVWRLKRLRFPRLAEPIQRDGLHTPAQVDPITGPADPRWVLAVRTAELLEGAILPAEQREKLIKVGTLMGLTPFGSNLVIAIVQDQARRGHKAEYCPTACESQLVVVPLSGSSRRLLDLRGRQILYVAALITAIIAVELLVLKALLF